MPRTPTDAIRELRVELQQGILLLRAARAAEDTREIARLKTEFLRWLRILLDVPTGPRPGEPGF